MQQPQIPMKLGIRAFAPVVARTLAGAAVIAVVMGSAIFTKRAGSLPALVGLERVENVTPSSNSSEALASLPEINTVSYSETTNVEETEVGSEPGDVEVIAIEDIDESSPEWDAQTRWFDGRPVRPSKVVVMKVTGYSPDHRSCGIFADGQTATLHSVWTNGMNLVAADPTVLPYGTMITVPGYANEEIVPVLDCGGAIKGNRLDLLFATHRRALVWGVQTVRVTIWDYADGEPAPNPRKVR
ncbi:MAG: 3D domain-containing protein [Phycisphaerales bacterium]